MPRWYDIPVVWLGLQVLVMAAFLADRPLVDP